jgi:hypothetical protein
MVLLDVGQVPVFQRNLLSETSAACSSEMLVPTIILHSVTSQETTIFTLTGLRTSELTFVLSLLYSHFALLHVYLLQLYPPYSRQTVQRIWTIQLKVCFLIAGLCITGIMAVLIGCRLRMVKRRLRRGGKSPYAHDADYLVNGMYL